MANYLDEAGLEELWAQIGSKYGVIFEHHWKRKRFVAAHTTETAFTNKFFEFANSSSYTSYIHYSDTVEVAADGTVSLGGDIESMMDNYQNISAYGAGKLAGKYFEVHRQRVATGEIYYFDPSATMTATTNNSYTYKYGFTISSCKKINGYANAYGEAEYLQSNSRNAYPDSGVSNGYVYDYLGVPLENAVSPVNMAHGSYVGTGTYGASNPCLITFDFEPKIVILWSNAYALGGYERSGYPVALRYTASEQTVSLGSDSGANIVFHFPNSSTLNFYSTKSADYQANVSGETYYFTAIG